MAKHGPKKSGKLDTKKLAKLWAAEFKKKNSGDTKPFLKFLYK